MRRCFLHFGTPKTGSTSFQAFLERHGSALLPFGLLVPTEGMGAGGNHHPVIKALAGETPGPRFRNAPAELSRALDRHPDKDVLLSAEWMDGALRTEAGLGIVRFFADRGFAVVLLGYFRNQPQFLNSAYAQGVKRLHVQASFDAYAEQFRRSGRHDHTFWLGLAERTGSRLLARPYNAAVRNGGVVRDLLRTLGIDPATIDAGSDPRANPSPGPCAIAVAQEAMRRAEASGHRWTHRQNVAAWHLFSRLTAEPAFAEAPFSGLDTERARALQAEFRPSNDAFARAVWGTDWASAFAEEVEAEFARNVYDPASAGSEQRTLHDALLDRFWAELSEIMRNPRLRDDHPAPRRAPARTEHPSP